MEGYTNLIEPEWRLLLCSCEDTGVPHRKSSRGKRIEMDQKSWPEAVLLML